MVPMEESKTKKSWHVLVSSIIRGPSKLLVVSTISTLLILTEKMHDMQMDRVRRREKVLFIPQNLMMRTLASKAKLVIGIDKYSFFLVCGIGSNICKNCLFDMIVAS